MMMATVTPICQYNRCNKPATVTGTVGETPVVVCYAHARQPDFKRSGLIDPKSDKK